MSIGLTCYSKLNVEELNDCINKITTDHPNIFPEKYALHPARPLGLFTEEIAADFDFYGVQSKAYISLRDKSLDVLPKEIANMMRAYVGEENILILFNNDTKY